jgi:hypothetical protein
MPFRRRGRGKGNRGTENHAGRVTFRFVSDRTMRLGTVVPKVAPEVAPSGARVVSIQAGSEFVASHSA